jgi:hypothetical protein
LGKPIQRNTKDEAFSDAVLVKAVKGKTSSTNTEEDTKGKPFADAVLLKVAKDKTAIVNPGEAYVPQTSNQDSCRSPRASS